MLRGRTQIADVQFYFYMRFGDRFFPLAMVSLFSPPDPAILAESSNTVYLCAPLDRPLGLTVVPITAILSVVSMFPDMAVTQDGHISHTGNFALMRHPYIELAQFAHEELFEDNDEAV
jgi:hypothetical protein